MGITHITNYIDNFLKLFHDNKLIIFKFELRIDFWAIPIILCRIKQIKPMQNFIFN